MTQWARRDRRWPFMVACLAAAVPGAASAAVPAGDASDTRWFQATEQSLMDAIAAGDKAPWDRILDKQCIVRTSSASG